MIILVGLGRGPLSLVSQLSEPKFSYCLTSVDDTKSSTLLMGSLASSVKASASEIKTTPLIQNSAQPSFYYLSLEGISVGETSLPIKKSTFSLQDDGSGGLIIDSGTTITYLEQSAFDLVAKEFTSQINLPVDNSGSTGLEPAVYVAESAISSGSAGTSADGSEGTAARAAGLGLISVAAASLILLLVGKNPSNNITTAEYKGPSLSYYINKFKPGEIIQAAVPSQTEPPSSIQADSSMPEVPEIQVQSAPDVSEVPVQSQSEPEPLTSSVSSASLAN